MNKLWEFASYNLWLLFSPPVGQEAWHCDRKRGYTKAKKKEAAVKALLERDTEWQRIGLLGQKGVYEFHQNLALLQHPDGVNRVAEILELEKEADEVQRRVGAILSDYRKNPFLSTKKIVKLARGDEGFPEPIVIRQGDFVFNLYAAIDCIVEEADGTLHVIDLKTGTSEPDRRQALVYLLACQYLYPDRSAIASFYNLETGEGTEPISANPNQLNAIQRQLATIAKRHQDELKRYRWNHDAFDEIYPANPHFNCKYCIFNPICKFSTVERAA
ncbi:PD-(D/E)XK nuclease family protein [Pannus brasiliensis CCIBt3594]|uniref:PD-(D/E)XK nuclease family protein n=1 Tax=Pannus brasiliensis CCIBt3594 TaxID=1427578 RepID=A0AAW9R0E8_9CHRO